MIKRLTLAAVVVPFVLAACQQGGAPGTVLATSLSDGQIQACANEVAAQSAFDRSLLSTVYGGETADGNGLVRVMAPNGNIFLCEVDFRVSGAKRDDFPKHRWLTGASLPAGRR